MFNSWADLSNVGNAYGSTPGSPDLTPTYDSNGYMNQFSLTQQANPYDSILSQGQNMMGGDARAAQSNQSSLNAQNQAFQSYQQQTYPSYPNAAGAGSQSAGMAPPMQGAGNQGNGSQTQPNASSQSFNPWSLTGESLSRVK